MLGFAELIHGIYSDVCGIILYHGLFPSLSIRNESYGDHRLIQKRKWSLLSSFEGHKNDVLIKSVTIWLYMIYGNGDCSELDCINYNRNGLRNCPTNTCFESSILIQIKVFSVRTMPEFSLGDGSM